MDRNGAVWEGDSEGEIENDLFARRGFGRIFRNNGKKGQPMEWCVEVVFFKFHRSGWKKCDHFGGLEDLNKVVDGLRIPSFLIAWASDLSWDASVADTNQVNKVWIESRCRAIAEFGDVGGKKFQILIEDPAFNMAGFDARVVTAVGGRLPYGNGRRVGVAFLVKADVSFLPSRAGQERICGGIVDELLESEVEDLIHQLGHGGFVGGSMDGFDDLPSCGRTIQFQGGIRAADLQSIESGWVDSGEASVTKARGWLEDELHQIGGNQENNLGIFKGNVMASSIRAALADKERGIFVTLEVDLEAAFQYPVFGEV